MARATKTTTDGSKPAPKKRRLTEFRGILPATKPYIGVEATRQQVARQLGEELERELRKADEEFRRGETIGMDELFTRIERNAETKTPQAKPSSRSVRLAPRSVKRRR